MAKLQVVQPVREGLIEHIRIEVGFYIVWVDVSILDVEQRFVHRIIRVYAGHLHIQLSGTFLLDLQFKELLD